MKKRSHIGRGVLAGAVIAATGGTLAYLAVVPAQAAGTPPQITTVTSHNGASTVTLGHPKPAATAHLSGQAVAYDSANGDEAVAVVTGTGQAHVYLIAGADEANEYHIATAPTTYGTLVKGDAYLVAGDGPLGQVADPGATTTTTGGSTSPYAVKNPVAPISLAFDHSGNLLINGYHTVTSVYTSGIQLVAKTTCSSSCPYLRSALAAGGLYTIAGEGMRGITRVPAVRFTFGVAGWGLAVDSHGNLLDSANGMVLYVNESTSSVTAYGKTLAARSAAVVAGTVTTGPVTDTCGGGTKTLPATGSTSPNLTFTHPYVDSDGNLYVNDNSSETGGGCAWVVPAATGTVDGISATAGNMYSLTGSASTTAFTNGATANTTNFSNTSAVVTDPAGNVVVSLSGIHPAVRVIAESTGSFYDQSMTKGDAYLISGGPTATRTTTPGNATGFEFAGVAVTFTPPAFGITSLVNGAPGDVLLANGASATTGSVYEITRGPTTPVGPKTTHTTLTVTPASPGYYGTTITLTATLSPTAAVGNVTFYNGSTAIGTEPVTSGAAHLHTTTLPKGTLTLQAKFVATTATAFTNSTSPTVSYKVETKPLTTVTGVKQPIAETVAAGHLTLSCTHYVTTEATAIKVCHLITLPKVTINGTTQTESADMNPVYVYTARGTATSGWALSAVMVPTTPLLNTNPTCASVQGFCDSTAGTHAATTTHGQIPATDLQLRGYACTPAGTNANPQPPAQPGGTLKTSRPLCAAAAGESGGVFTLGDGSFTLTIPSTIYHGLYYGTVEYSLVST